MFCPNDTILYNKAPAFALIRPHAIPSRETNTTFCRLLLFMASFLMARAAIEAKARLAHVVVDDMVARRQAAVRLWGCGATGFEARVLPSWAAKIYAASVANDGKWTACAKTPKAAYTPLSIVFDDNDGKIATISRALSGEGWACAGQTDMEMPMGLFFMSAQCRKTMKSS